MDGSRAATAKRAAAQPQHDRALPGPLRGVPWRGRPRLGEADGRPVALPTGADRFGAGAAGERRGLAGPAGRLLGRLAEARRAERTAGVSPGRLRADEGGDGTLPP